MKNVLKIKILMLFASSLMLSACNSSKSDNNDKSNIVVDLTPEREGHSVARMWNDVFC